MGRDANAGWGCPAAPGASRKSLEPQGMNPGALVISASDAPLFTGLGLASSFGNKPRRPARQHPKSQLRKPEDIKLSVIVFPSCFQSINVH